MFAVLALLCLAAHWSCHRRGPPLNWWSIQVSRVWNFRFTWTRQTINLSLILFLTPLDLLTNENKDRLFRTGSVFSISVKTTEATLMPEATKTPGLKWLWFIRLSLTLWAYMCSRTDTAAWELSSSQNVLMMILSVTERVTLIPFTLKWSSSTSLSVCLNFCSGFWSNFDLCSSKGLWSDSKETYYVM